MYARHPGFASLLFAVVATALGTHAQVAHATPAAPVTLTIEQPDGTTIVARQRGTAWCNRLETLDGRLIQRGPGGWWRIEAPVAPHADTPGIRGWDTRAWQTSHACVASPWAWADARQAQSAGDFRTYPVLMILVSFTDRDPTYSAGAFAELLGNDLPAYYYAASYGAAQTIPAREAFGTAGDGVVGWLPLKIPHPDTGPMLQFANQRLARTAIEAADPYVNYADYDTNGDGYVDSDELAVVVVAAGYDYAYGPQPPSVWAHSWWLNTVEPPDVDGVVVGAYHGNHGGYAEIGEIHATSASDAHRANVGTLAHELGHLIFRLPDLYDIDHSSDGIGPYCLMSSGSWGFTPEDDYPGDTPVLPSAYIRWRLGWSQPTIADGRVTVRAAGSPLAGPDDTVVLVPTPDLAQVFLVENRQPDGYDLGLVGLLGGSFGGMAIWHIDENAWINAVDFRRLADLEEANGSDTPWSAQALWYAGNPDSGGVFGPHSTPNSDLFPQKSSGVTITDFSPPGEIMAATVEAQID